MGETRLRLGQDGRLAAIETGTAAAQPIEPGEYRLAIGPSQTFLLTRHSDEPRARGRVLMMGELITRMSVVEVINLVTAATWSGELHIDSPLGSRTLTIAQGVLQYARSEVENERLGELLVRAGAIEAAQLRALLPQKKHDERFGQLLVRRGLVDEQQLFKQLQQQAETIFYAAMLIEHGMYWFIAPPETAPPPPTTFHLPIQGLLMEGVQRIDEMALYRERIPHNRFFPAATPTGRRDSLEPTLLTVLTLCSGTRSIDDLIRATGLGEFSTLRAVFNLMRGGQIKLRSGPLLDGPAARRMVGQFNEIVRDIFVAVATYDTMERARRALSGWLAGSRHGQVLGDDVDIDGTLDAARVLASLEALGSDDPMPELHRALHELAAYALFVASNWLPRNDERALSRHVNHQLRQLRL